MHKIPSARRVLPLPALTYRKAVSEFEGASLKSFKSIVKYKNAKVEIRTDGYVSRIS